MKLISTINKAVGFSAKVYYNSELSEYVVKYFEGKEILHEGTWYYSNDKDDAINTAHHELNYMANNNAFAD